MHQALFIGLVLLGSASVLHLHAQGIRVLEIHPKQVRHLPGGKEADGIIGDFVLENELIKAVVSQNAPLRRANMGTFYGSGGVTPGCLYDLTLRSGDNDQITVFAPSGQRGEVSYVRIIDDLPRGTVGVETVVTASRNGGLFKRHQYLLEQGWQGIRVVSTFRNEGEVEIELNTDDTWTRFQETGVFHGVDWADSVDPDDRQGYARIWESIDDRDFSGGKIAIQPGESRRVSRFLSVGRSPAEAFSRALERVHSGTGKVQILLNDDLGKPVETATVWVRDGENRIPAYPDERGSCALTLRAGGYELSVEDRGRESSVQLIQVLEGEAVVVSMQLGPVSRISFDVRDDFGGGIPCKVQFEPLGNTPAPRLGPANRAHGCLDQYHSETGRFSVAVDPGKYKVTVTRGIEYDYVARQIDLLPGADFHFAALLRREVDSRGWISADFHNHSTPSGDNVCGTDDRVINLAAEHIEFAPTTEHNRLYDWSPHIERLGLSGYLKTIPGIELTGSGTHLNAFPFEPVPFTQDGGAPVWVNDPRISALILRDFQGARADRWVHANHPDMVKNFIDRDENGIVDGGYEGLVHLVDAIETQNGNTNDILAGQPCRIVTHASGKESVRFIREFIWLQMLNQGHRYWGTAVSDAHSVHGNGVGGWRVYVKSSTDQPSEIDWQEISRHSKSGKSFLTTGPFLEVWTDDGDLPGDTFRVSIGQKLGLNVRIQCANWIKINRVQVLINGVRDPRFNYTSKSHPDWFSDRVVCFDQRLEIPLESDAHIIVVAIGENQDLRIGYGSSPQSGLAPCAYNNPLFVDVDGNGFKANGDTLGFPLPTGGWTVERVKALLSRR